MDTGKKWILIYAPQNQHFGKYSGLNIGFIEVLGIIAVFQKWNICFRNEYYTPRIKKLKEPTLINPKTKTWRSSNVLICYLSIKRNGTTAKTKTTKWMNKIHKHKTFTLSGGIYSIIQVLNNILSIMSSSRYKFMSHARATGREKSKEKNGYNRKDQWW